MEEEEQKLRLPPSPALVAALWRVAKASYALRDSGPDDGDWNDKCTECSDALDALTEAEAKEQVE